ncbi:MAG TPA: hypothetical protein VJ851_02150 [Jatrophihabitans sp.]|nr:hypothetical protein [Jatrophihabitans sp.]
MEYWLLFWGATDGGFEDAEVADRLRHGQWNCAAACPDVAEFRRDLLASDPDWTAMRLLPRPGSGQPADRYLAVVFVTAPDADEVRDLRYLAARNRLRMFDPQAAEG